MNETGWAMALPRTTVNGAARLFAACLGVFAAWGLGVAIVTAVAEPFEIVMVFGPAAATHAAVARSPAIAFVASSQLAYVVKSESPGFVRHLYANGAWLVLPANDGGCLAREPAQVPARGPRP
jgi:hypothetical protein